MTIIAPPPPPAPPAAPPVSAAPPPLTPGGRTAVRVFLVIAASVVVVGTVLSLGATAWGVSTFRVVADETAFPSDTRSLVIDTGDVPAALRLRTDRDAREPRVSMRLLKSARSGERTLRVDQDAQTTRITVNGVTPEFMGWGRAGEITVTLPPEMARRLSVTTTQDKGVLLVQADLDSLVASNTYGAVILSGAARRIDVTGQDGTVLTRDPISVSESFVAESVDGEISVDFKEAPPRTVEASTRTGDIAISLPTPGPYLVRASGDSARVRVPETTDPARAAAQITARSDEGDVVVEGAGAGRHR
ncbi:hypothetical protein [Mycolicibacterium sp. 624]|uniref:hypothetical protein n=1 Tax=Mycolicibacterium sp. 624 TaxID=3156314 RepID=UPI00339B87CF